MLMLVPACGLLQKDGLLLSKLASRARPLLHIHPPSLDRSSACWKLCDAVVWWLLRTRPGTNANVDASAPHWARRRHARQLGGLSTAPLPGALLLLARPRSGAETGYPIPAGSGRVLGEGAGPWNMRTELFMPAMGGLMGSYGAVPVDAVLYYHLLA